MAAIWNAIKQVSIIVKYTNPNGIATIPDGHAMLAADQVYKMLEWIEAEFQEDCRKNFSVLEQNMVGQNDFVVRNISRTLSYVTQACLLEGILKRSYNLTAEHLKNIDESVMLDADQIRARDQEIKILKDFRNKIAAHTAYSNPRAEDNIAQELHSLLALISTSYHGSINTFRLGASTMIVGAMEAKFQPEVSINEVHPLLIEHFKQWLSMFEKILTHPRSQLPKIINNVSYEI